MKTLLTIPATVRVERTESGGKPRERIVLKPVLDERSKLGPPDELVLTNDTNVGALDGVTEVEITISAKEEPAEKKHKKD